MTALGTSTSTNTTDFMHPTLVVSVQKTPSDLKTFYPPNTAVAFPAAHSNAAAHLGYNAHI